ncbi:MAG: two-component system regulatory protein YycI [Bacillota bacterium]
MDWSKAKNILIAAFIITNIFLIVNIERELMSANDFGVLTQDQVNEILDILEEKNVTVDTSLPPMPMVLSNLDVAYETFDKDDVYRRLSSDGVDDGRWRIYIYENRLICVSSQRKTSLTTLDETVAYDKAIEFIESYQWAKKEEIDHWTTFFNGREYEVVFKQRYKGFFLESSEMRVFVDQEGIKQFERVWLEPIKMKTKKYAVMPAPKAILLGIDRLKEYDEEIIIQDIQLGYWFSWDNAKSGTAIPAWRIRIQGVEEPVFFSADENY